MNRNHGGRFLAFLGVSSLLISLGACADYSYYDNGRYAGNYDVYYDGFYGELSDGYWSDDGWFYYRDARNRGYHRDDARHFRRDAADGYKSAHLHHERRH